MTTSKMLEHVITIAALLTTGGTTAKIWPVLLTTNSNTDTTLAGMARSANSSTPAGGRQAAGGHPFGPNLLDHCSWFHSRDAWSIWALACR